MTENTIHTTKIDRIINNCKGVKTLIFKSRTSIVPNPGQFVMIWVPGIDEIPMSISGCDETGNWAITVKNIGECTQALQDLKIGDLIGVRGPLGNFFMLPSDRNKMIFLIGGGIGIAPLKYLAFILTKLNFNYKFIVGAKNQDDIIHIDEFTNLEKGDSDLLYCTDDGSYGEKGFTSEVFETALKESRKEVLSEAIVYTCGPEKMMYALFKICMEYNIELYASLERIMRCGCGLCGLCALDPSGLLVCKDGPVFSLEQLKKIKDFGKFKRDFTGKKIPIE